MKCNEKSLQKYLNDNDKDAAVLCALKMLENQDISVVNLFEKVLIPGLINFSCGISKQECMWKYKVRKLISNSIINSSYVYVIKQKKKSNNIKSLVCCPLDEANEIFDDVVNDYLILAGYDSVNIGAESNYDEIENALQTTKSQILVLAVTNPMHIIRAKKLIEFLKKDYPYVKIAVYGPGFDLEANRDQLEFDYYITNYQSVLKMEGK